MFQTAFTYQLTHFARFLSLPERLQNAPLRNLSLEPLRQRNTALDAFFYDIKVVTPDEAFYISDSLAAVGSLLIVPPSGQGQLTLCDTLDEYFLRGGAEVTVLALAGAGGSALGAAAFARNVADAVGKPVATVVPGYGIADAIGEVMGGTFLFGWLGQVRHGFESVDDLSGRPHYGVDPEKNAAAAACPHHCRDVQTVLALLADPRAKIGLLAAHSRGNTMLSEALTAMRGIDAKRLADIAASARVVTFGAKIAMPPVFTDVIDVIGEWDWFGEINSRPFIATDRRIGNVGHHTNTEIPGHIDVANVLREILAAGPQAGNEENIETAETALQSVTSEPQGEAAAEAVPQQDAAPVEEPRPAASPVEPAPLKRALETSAAIAPAPAPVLPMIAPEKRRPRKPRAAR